jgi:hypothetical protein
MKPRTTPDGRYLVVRGRLWRAANPHLPARLRARFVRDLMEARRALKSGDPRVRARARAAVEAAKIALGERGAPWWKDGAKDFNRHLVKNTPYAAWYRRGRQT